MTKLNLQTASNALPSTEKYFSGDTTMIRAMKKTLQWLFDLTSTGYQINKIQHKGLPPIMQKLMALMGLLVLSPILATVALLIKLDSRGPVIFWQIRIGANGRHFRCYKFRSMYLQTDPKFRAPDPSESDREGLCKKYKKDPRITPIGRIIRKYSIDEIPQLFNVILGDMLLIGPRPPLKTEYEKYDRAILPRLYCIPGITGLWQVKGRAELSFKMQMELDKEYVAKQSPWLDTKIILATIPAVVSAKGAY